MHIGTARSALFNWLFTKNLGGKFILRIEDTDTERSKPEFEQGIISGLKWLGLAWDEGPDVGGAYGPYRQSERLDIYEKYLKQLLDADHAYYCFCGEEELDAERKAMLAKGLAPKYNGKCRAQNAKTGNGVIRFKVPEEKIAFDDIVRGRVEFDGSLMGDIVIAKSLQLPLYNFAVVVDDSLMRISHVIRAEEHLGNTPKQLFIARALGFAAPTFAHIPLILDANRAKLSKRFGATAVDEYRHDGYLPEAIINFLALLGWHPQGNDEIMPIDRIVKEFSLERVQKAGAVFDTEKLKWMNAHYIKSADAKTLVAKITDLYPAVAEHAAHFTAEQLEKIIALAKERMQTLNEFETAAAFFFAPADYDAKLLLWKTTPQETIVKNLHAALEAIKNIPVEDFTVKILDPAIKAVADTLGRGETYWPLRVALSGRDASPGPIEIMDALGKEESVKRIAVAIEKL